MPQTLGDEMPMVRMPADWSTVGTLVAVSEWLRRESGALCVLVIRVNDSTLAADPGLAPADALGLIEEYAPGLAAELEQARQQKRGASLELKDGPR
jgi:hypothetical protein